MNNNALTFFNVAKVACSLMIKSRGSIAAISEARNVYYFSNPGYAAGKGSIIYKVPSLVVCHLQHKGKCCCIRIYKKGRLQWPKI